MARNGWNKPNDQGFVNYDDYAWGNRADDIFKKGGWDNVQDACGGLHGANYFKQHCQRNR